VASASLQSALTPARQVCRHTAAAPTLTQVNPAAQSPGPAQLDDGLGVGGTMQSVYRIMLAEKLTMHVSPARQPDGPAAVTGLHGDEHSEVEPKTVNTQRETLLGSGEGPLGTEPGGHCASLWQ
jgi:hypothetical protein